MVLNKTSVAAATSGTITALLLTLLLYFWPDAEPPPVNRVFIQGSSTTELIDLVTAAGGKITHDLHIINAVGAEVTPDQLGKIIASPLVARHLDDVSLQNVKDDACSVNGSLEVELRNNSLAWKLHNKKQEPAHIEKIVVAAPNGMGSITALIGRLGTQIQTCTVRNYILMFTIGVVLVLGYYAMAMGR